MYNPEFEKKFNEIFSKNLRRYMDERNVSQNELAKMLNVSPTSVNNWYNGYKTPRMDKVDKICKFFHISRSDIMDDHDPDDLSGVTNISYPAAYPVPILGTICAGNGVWCEDNFDGVFFVDRSIKADLCLNVRGDSMEDAEIHDGDKAFILKDCDIESGKIYAVRINGDSEAVLKVVHWKNDSVVLSSRNSAYEPLIESEDNISIIGECVGVYHATK